MSSLCLITSKTFPGLGDDYYCRVIMSTGLMSSCTGIQSPPSNGVFSRMPDHREAGPLHPWHLPITGWYEHETQDDSLPEGLSIVPGPQPALRKCLLLPSPLLPLLKQLERSATAVSSRGPQRFRCGLPSRSAASCPGQSCRSLELALALPVFLTCRPVNSQRKSDSKSHRGIPGLWCLPPSHLRNMLVPFK